MIYIQRYYIVQYDIVYLIISYYIHFISCHFYSISISDHVEKSLNPWISQVTTYFEALELDVHDASEPILVE